MLASILLEVAGSLAAPVIKKILDDKLGGAGGELAGRVVDIIAEKAGVSVDKLADAKNLPAVIEAAEPMPVELLAAHVESQRLMNETLQAELDKGGPTWTWAWRPFGMWLFLGLVAVLRSSGSAHECAALGTADLAAGYDHVRHAVTLASTWAVTRLRLP